MRWSPLFLFCSCLCLCHSLVLVHSSSFLSSKSPSSSLPYSHNSNNEFDSSNGTANGCALYENCSSCISNPDCGWCLNETQDGVCMNGTASGPLQKNLNCTDWRFFDCENIFDRCLRYPTCAKCADDRNCGWCTNVCLAGNATGPYDPNIECPEWTWNRACGVDKCIGYQSCNACVSDTKCGWCNNICLSGNITGPTIPFNCPNWIWNSPCRTPCSTYTTCAQCIKQDYCGWCNQTSVAHSIYPTSTSTSTRLSSSSLMLSPLPSYTSPLSSLDASSSSSPQSSSSSEFSLNSRTSILSSSSSASTALGTMCMEGNTDGPRRGKCQAGEWFWETCERPPVTCESHLDCGTCIADSSSQCGWCVTTGACINTTISKNCSKLWTHSCQDPCNQYNECYLCSKDPSCGWCNETKCVSGNTNGPDKGFCSIWEYKTCKPSDCNIFRSCSTCTRPGNDHCAWCDPYERCLYISNPPPKTGDPRCPYNWFWQQCPPPVSCTNYKTCSDCMAYPEECWWCTKNGQGSCTWGVQIDGQCSNDVTQCNPKPPPSDGGDGALGAGPIAGIVVGCVLGAGIVFGGVVVWYRVYWLKRHYYEVLK
jgi:hypothetical protein